MLIRSPIIPLDEFAKLQDSGEPFFRLFQQAYQLCYKDLGFFSKEFFETVFDYIVDQLENLGKLTNEKMSKLSTIHANLAAECIFMLLTQATSQLQIKKAPEDDLLYYKCSYIRLMEQTKQFLFSDSQQSLALIKICMEQLVAGFDIQQFRKEVNTWNYIMLKDTQFFIELLINISDNLERPAQDCQQILKSIFLLNQERGFKLSQIVFFNLNQVLRFNPDATYVAVQALRIFSKQRSPTVYNQLREFVADRAGYLQLDDLSVKLTLQILIYLKKFGLFDPLLNQELLDSLAEVFLSLWFQVQNETKAQFYEDKTEFWNNYIHSVNLCINPSAVTPARRHSEAQVICCLYVLLKDHKTLFTNSYLSTRAAILDFIDTTSPFSENLLRSSNLSQSLVQLSVDFILKGDLRQEEGILDTFSKVLQMVIHLNSSQKKDIFRMIWNSWNPDDDFYLSILQRVVTQFLVNDEKKCAHLGTRNEFFYVILEVETQKKYLHPKKFQTLLNILQYLCLDGVQIDVQQIYNQNQCYDNIPILKSHKIKQSFQEFFQVNKYFQIILSLIARIQNSAVLTYILKEFLKLTWLLTTGWKAQQVDFAEGLGSHLERWMDQLQPEQQQEIQDLLLDCCTGMVSYFVRKNSVSEINYSEFNVLNPFCLKMLADVFIISDCTPEDVQLRALNYVNSLIRLNAHNQNMFRESICLSDLLNKQRKSKSPLKERYEDLMKSSLKFIMSDEALEILRAQSQDPIGQKLSKQKTFRESSISQYVSQTLDLLSNVQQAEKNKRLLQFLGLEGGILIRNLTERKDWKAFTFVVEAKLEGLQFYNQQALNPLGAFKEEQVLLQIAGVDQHHQQDMLVLSLKRERSLPLRLGLHLQLYDEKGSCKEFSMPIHQAAAAQNLALVVTYDDRHRGNVEIKQQDQASSFACRLCIREFFKKNQKAQVTVCVGGYYEKGKFSGTKSLQGVLGSFLYMDGLIFQADPFAEKENKTQTILEYFDHVLHKLPIEQYDSLHYKTIQYLDLEKLKSSLFQLTEVKECMQIIKMVEKQSDNNFLDMFIKKAASYKLVHETNKVAKVTYQGINCVETTSFAEIFLSAENIQIILFMLVLTNHFVIETKTQRHCSSKGIHYSDHLNKGVYRIKHYYDSYGRKFFLFKDMRKNREDYLNATRFQEQIRLQQKKCSIKTQGSSPGLKSNFLAINAQESVLISPESKDETDSNQYGTPALSQDQRPEIDMRAISANNNFRRIQTKHLTQNYSPPVQTRDFDLGSAKRIINTKEDEISKKHKAKQFEAEWIRVQGQYFGYVTFIEERRILKFKSSGAPRPDKDHLQYGTLPDNLKKVVKVKLINISSIQEVQTRRYTLKEIAVEIFCRNQKAYFFNLFSTANVDLFLAQLQKVSNKTVCEVRDRRQAFVKKDFQNKWLKGELSNFEYLMLVNKYSGRTFNDLSQYPVFPWVLADYQSKELNLQKRDVYRDLEKCIGAINAARLNDCKYRAESLRQSANEVFLYGSHYSVPAQIINTLVRVEPYTTLQTELQDGRLEQPDRIYFSVPNIWDSCQNDQQDFRELIPEYFYFPEFLQNINGIDFGARQNNELVDNVQLPPWATTPEQFVEINRQALESEYVTTHLHHWINLVFGVHQAGEEALQRDNLFHWLTYESCWAKIEKMPKEDVIAYISQIQNFGQTPHQLFTKPHPARTKIAIGLPQVSTILKGLTEQNFTPAKLERFDKRPAIKLGRLGSFGAVAILQSKQVVRILQGQSTELLDLAEKDKLHFESTEIWQNEQVGHKGPKLVTGEQFAFDEEQQVFVCGYQSCMVYGFTLSLERGPQISRIIKLHKQRVTCLTYSSKFKMLCLGGKDCRVTVWRLQNSEKPLHTTPRFILYGHEKSVRCIRVEEVAEMVISVDKAGVVIIHALHTGVFLREIRLPLNPGEKVRKLVVNQEGMMALLTTQSNIILTKVNGCKRLQYNYKVAISDMALYGRQHLLVSTFRGELILLQDVNVMGEAHPLFFHIYQDKNHTPILSFTYYKENECQLVFLLSLEDGTIVKIAVATEQTKLFLKQIEKLGILTQ